MDVKTQTWSDLLDSVKAQSMIKELNHGNEAQGARVMNIV